MSWYAYLFHCNYTMKKYLSFLWWIDAICDLIISYLYIYKNFESFIIENKLMKTNIVHLSPYTLKAKIANSEIQVVDHD